MPSLSSSSIPNNLVFAGITFIKGSTGPTGPTGATGYSLTGPTGPDGIQYISSNIFGYTLGITYGTSGFFFSVTGPQGSTQRKPLSGFIVGETGGIESASVFAGYDITDNYLLKFKTIKLFGEVTGGISLGSLYIESPSTSNTNVGNTGSLLYITTGPAGFGQVIDSTNDTVTAYLSGSITPIVGSLFGITLDVFRFRTSQDLTTQFKTGIDLNLNLINLSDTNWKNGTLATYVNTYGVSFSNVFNDYSITRTDQSLVTVFKNDETHNLKPIISFRTEGITLNGITTGVVDVKIPGKGITYSTLTYKDSIIGSCCYCGVDTEDENVLNRSCIDYASKDFCEAINGTFGFKSCNERYLSGECYSGGACCVNGVCIETNRDFCKKVYGKFYPNIKCNDLEFGCPANCPVDASCCVNGQCLSLPSGSASEDLCNELKGTYKDEPCTERNCCIEGFKGACCFGQTTCIDDMTPIECSNHPVYGKGVFQGPGSFCASSNCCKDNVNTLRKTEVQTDNSFAVPSDLKVGDYFAGGIVAGFIGFPPPPGFDQSSYFAKGQVISELENTSSPQVKRYVAVNGAYSSKLQCNCSNFSPSRYMDIVDLANNNGKANFYDIKSLSGVTDKVRLSFLNRLSDTCLTDENKPCNDYGPENKKYGFNSIGAYKKLAKQVHGSMIPNAWILIVAPEDFYSENVSFGMSMSVSGFEIPSNLGNYTDKLWQDNILAPYGTTVFDGLVNTRMFDKTSISSLMWFIPNNYGFDGTIKSIDPLAYHRFKHSKINYWQSDIDVELLKSSSDYFKTKYEEMWNAINTPNTALYNISEKNEQMYNGYSDWYIPSALELNVIYYNLQKINNGIIRNSSGESWRTISQSKYWSSTTGGKLTNLKIKEGIKYFEDHNQMFENAISSQGDYLLDSWKRLKTNQAHRAFTQDFSTGKMVSELKTTSAAKLRACRMIPTYIKNENLQDQFEFSFKTLNTCSSCR